MTCSTLCSIRTYYLFSLVGITQVDGAELFVCGECGHTDNADRNAALVIKKRAIKLILNTETVLSNKGVLDKGRGVARQTQGGESLSAGDYESSKKKRTASKLSLVA